MKQLIKKVLGEKMVIYLRAMKSKYSVSKKEQEITDRSKKFYSSFITKGDLCYDVGANVGNRIDPLLKIGARVLAVEPQQSCSLFLKYKYGNKIILVTEGLSSKEEIKDFYISDFSVISSFSEEWINKVKENRFKKNEWNKVVKTKMTTLDKTIEKWGAPAFIKIDVEGYELEVLKGLSKPVKLISFEYTVPEQITKNIDCINHLQSIDNNIECNYSVGESMELAMTNWIPAEEMKRLIKSDAFIVTGFGDIYIRNKNA